LSQIAVLNGTDWVNDGASAILDLLFENEPARMLTMALPFWHAYSKILSTDHEDSGNDVPLARGG
jgi:hypothetical protein